MTLKQRIHAGQSFQIGMLSIGMAKEEIKERVSGQSWDLAFVDLQHTPHTEPGVVAFCRASEAAGIPIMFRIPHPLAVWQASRYLDFGAAAILVPMAENAHIVRQAVDNVYYPPVGNRSCGLTHAYGWKRERSPAEYADWWNRHAVLAIQIETVRAALDPAVLVVPGVDLVLFGAVDLQFSIDATPDCPFASVADCQDHVAAALKNADVRVGVADLPFGAFASVDGASDE